MKQEKMINKLSELKIFAREFASRLHGGEFIALIGNLGAGKTAFVKAVCENFGIEEANSPSFAIVNEYFGTYRVYHIDFYRIKNADELLNVGYFEYINDSEAIKFVEWADMFEDFLPQKRIEIKIEQAGEEKRKFIIKEIS
jgi:tRNA threonylcarbamoyladenosine biosynthesis protein TsaE